MKNSRKSVYPEPQILGDAATARTGNCLGKVLAKFLGVEGNLSNVKNEGGLYYIYIILFIILIE